MAFPDLCDATQIRRERDLDDRLVVLDLFLCPLVVHDDQRTRFELFQFFGL